MDMKNHLLSRNFLPIDSVYLTEETATFLLYSFDYKLSGYQQYRPLGVKLTHKDPKLGKYFTYTNKPCVWGLNYVPFSSHLIICEGIFKACLFHNYGIPAIAALTNNPVHLTDQLKLLSLTTKLIVVPDPDAAGKRLLKYGTHFLIPDSPLDEMSTSEFHYFLNQLRTFL